MENYICINGNKTELTEEQLKQLGIELPKASPFNRVDKGKLYYTIHGDGMVYAEREDGYSIDDGQFNTANYCTSKVILEQRALHETMSRLLWRYSMEHAGDKMNLNNANVFRYGIKRRATGEWTTFPTTGKLFGTSMFATETIAENAIEEIVKPFIAAHPDFKF